MGVAASAELEQAQGQVKRLTVEMQKLSTALKGKESALSAVTREALELRQHKDKTADVQLELSRTAEELRAARRGDRRAAEQSKQQHAAVEEELAARRDGRAATRQREEEELQRGEACVRALLGHPV